MLDRSTSVSWIGSKPKVHFTMWAGEYILVCVDTEMSISLSPSQRCKSISFRISRTKCGLATICSTTWVADTALTNSAANDRNINCNPILRGDAVLFEARWANAHNTLKGSASRAILVLPDIEASEASRAAFDLISRIAGAKIVSILACM